MEKHQQYSMNLLRFSHNNGAQENMNYKQIYSINQTVIMSNLNEKKMKKNYFLTALLFFAIALNSQAQFVELEGKEPVFWLKFEELDGSGRHIVNGTEAFNNFVTTDGTLIENDTIKGHAWGGGTFASFTFLDQIVSSDSIKEMFLPTFFWNSYVSIPDRPQGIAGYSNLNGGYFGPRGTSPRTVSFYAFYTDSARVDTSGTAAWEGNHMFFDGGQWDLAGGGGMIRWQMDPATMKMEFDWGLSKDFTPEGAMSSNQWVHLALTVPDGAAREDIKLYVNGIHQEFVAEESYNQDGVNMTALNTTPTAAWDGIRIGRLANVWMADYRVYDAELSQNEVRELMGRFPLSAKNFESQNTFNIYPVPNNGLFNIQIFNTDARNIVVKNILGQVVHKQTVDNMSTVDAGDLSSGMYFVTLLDGNRELQTKKILVK